MMRDLFRRLVGSPIRKNSWISTDRHVQITSAPSVIYAIGDVHGCLPELLSLERKIVEDSSQIEGRKLLVMLGDYIDRGPQSAGVIDHLLKDPPASFERFCLMGNHEAMAAAFLARPLPGGEWLRVGGMETLQSYGLAAETLVRGPSGKLRQTLEAYIPQEHQAFLRNCFWTLGIPGWLFVHAGLRPGVPITQQRPDDLFWIREDFYSAPAIPGLRVVHGHTPAGEPIFAPGRICIDTGAFATGRLTALKVTPDGKTDLLSTP